MGFPSVPGLFVETKLCSIPSPTQQAQKIPVTSSRHTLKNYHPPATETSMLPISINTHITLASYIHILCCLCPISLLGSEILIFYYLPLSSSSFSWLSETQESKTGHLPMLQTPLKMKQTHDCSEVFISFHIVQISINSLGQGLASGASTAQMS